MVSEISVVICAYTEKRWDDLVAAVQSLQVQTLAPVEIILVIDHNAALLRRSQEYFSGVTVIENSGSKGLSGARNSGWSLARGEVVAFLDDDAVAEPDWLAQLAACYDDPNVVGAGGKLVPLWETGKPFWFPEEFNWVVGCTYLGMPSNTARIRNVIGANMSARKTVLQLAGGFHEGFGYNKGTGTTSKNPLKRLFKHYIGDEETEFCIRVSQLVPGAIWLYAPTAVVHHHVSPDRTRLKYFVRRCYGEGVGKASLVKLHDSSTGLSAERAYTFSILPRGVLRGLTDPFLRLKPAGVCRAGAIVLGLGMTGFGYVLGTLSARSNSQKQIGIESVNPQFQPPVNVPS